MSDFGDLFEQLSEALEPAIDQQKREPLVIVIGGTEHMSKGMREQLFNGLNRPGLCVMTSDQFEASRTPEARELDESLLELYALQLREPVYPGIKLDRVRQGKGERKRNKRHRYRSGYL